MPAVTIHFEAEYVAFLADVKISPIVTTPMLAGAKKKLSGRLGVPFWCCSWRSQEPWGLRAAMVR